jgi:hypothetical protein
VGQVGQVRQVGRVGLVIALLAGAVASSGCLVLALQPAYDDPSVVYDEALTGEWANPEDATLATIERAEWRSYKVTYTDRFTTRTFHGNLTKIGTSNFLDLTDVRGADAGPYLLPVHGVFRVTVAGGLLSAAPLDYGWFTRAITQKPAGSLVAAFDDRRNVVVASTTAELRRWLMHAPAEAFSAPMTFRRKP